MTIDRRFDSMFRSWRGCLVIDLHGLIKSRHDAAERMAGRRPPHGVDNGYWRGVRDVLSFRIEMTREEIDFVDELQRIERHRRHLEGELMRRRQRLWRK